MPTFIFTTLFRQEGGEKVPLTAIYTQTQQCISFDLLQKDAASGQDDIEEQNERRGEPSWVSPRLSQYPPGHGLSYLAFNHQDWWSIPLGRPSFTPATRDMFYALAER